MNPELLIAAALLVAVAAIATRRRAELEASQGDALPGLNAANVLEELSNTFSVGAEVSAAAAEANVRAFLYMIRYAEGTDDASGYRALFGHTRARPRLFDSFDDHPRVASQFTDGAGRRLWTSAAGAYQFMAVSPLPSGGATRVDTWDRIRRKLGLADFSPLSQDRAAVALIDEAGALEDVKAGRFDAAVRKVRGVWASLPGAGYSQPERTLAALRSTYVNHGGTLA